MDEIRTATDLLWNELVTQGQKVADELARRWTYELGVLDEASIPEGFRNTATAPTGGRFVLKDDPQHTTDLLVVLGLARPTPDADLAIVNTQTGEVLMTFVVEDINDSPTTATQRRLRNALRSELAL